MRDMPRDSAPCLAIADSMLRSNIKIGGKCGTCDEDLQSKDALRVAGAIQETPSPEMLRGRRFPQTVAFSSVSLPF